MVAMMLMIVMWSYNTCLIYCREMLERIRAAKASKQTAVNGWAHPSSRSSSNSLLTTICLIISSYADLICIILSICHRHCMFFFGRCTVHWTNFGFPLKECVAYSPAAVIALSVYCMCEVDCQWSGCMWSMSMKKSSAEWLMSKATSHDTIICYNKKMIQHDLLYDYSMRIRYIIISHQDAADDARHISYHHHTVYTLC